MENLLARRPKGSGGRSTGTREPSENEYRHEDDGSLYFEDEVPIVGKLIELFFYVPLLPQIVLTALFYFSAKLLGRAHDKTKTFLFGLTISFIVWGVFIGAVQWSQGKYGFWFIVSYVAIVGILVALLRTTTTHKVPKALASIVGIYVLSFALFSGVKRPLAEKLTWEVTGKVGAPGLLAEKEIVFRFVNFPNHFQQVYSDALATKLVESQTKEVEGKFTLYYSWGDFTGHHLDSVDQYEIPSKEGGGAGTTGDYQPSPFPKTFLGVR